MIQIRDTPLRVLHVIPSVSPTQGGPSFALASIARALVSRGVEITVATSDDDGPGRRLRVPLEEPVVGPEGVRSFYFAKNMELYKVSLGLRAWLRAHVREFDLVHVHALFSFSSIAAANAARSAKIPYIVRPLGVLNRWGLRNRRSWLKKMSLNWLELPLLQRASAIHYTSLAERNEAAEAHPAIAGLPSAARTDLSCEWIERPDRATKCQRPRQRALFQSIATYRRGAMPICPTA